MNMSDSLNALKDAISEHPDLGPLQKMHQRIFHLGRELKTGGRSLAKLGVGRFRVYMVHLAIPREHRQPPTAVAASAAAAKERETSTSKSNNKRNSSGSSHNSSEDIHIDDDDDVVEIVEPKRRRVAVPPRGARAGPREVISLDDSDDDDDLVEIIEAQVPVQRRRR